METLKQNAMKRTQLAMKPKKNGSYREKIGRNPLLRKEIYRTFSYVCLEGSWIWGKILRNRIARVKYNWKSGVK